MISIKYIQPLDMEASNEGGIYSFKSKYHGITMRNKIEKFFLKSEKHKLLEIHSQFLNCIKGIETLIN